MTINKSPEVCFIEVSGASCGISRADVYQCVLTDKHEPLIRPYGDNGRTEPLDYFTFKIDQYSQHIVKNVSVKTWLI